MENLQKTKSQYSWINLMLFLDGLEEEVRVDPLQRCHATKPGLFLQCSIIGFDWVHFPQVFFASHQVLPFGLPLPGLGVPFHLADRAGQAGIEAGAEGEDWRCCRRSVFYSHTSP